MYEIILGRAEDKRKKYGLSGTIFVGKHYIQMGQSKSLANKIYMDVSSPHVVLISGKRGSGKCLTGNTLITLEDGRCIPIKDLENDNSRVFGLDSNLKVDKFSKSKFYKRKVNKIQKISLRSGREIELTPEHPLLTVLGWKEAQELQVGSRIATPRRCPNFGDQELPEYKIKLLAYLIAEGHLGNGFVLFSNEDEDIVTDFKTSVKQFDSNLRVDNHGGPTCYRVSQIEKQYILSKQKRNDKGQFISGGVRYQKSSINKWLREQEIYNKLSLEKFIPACVFTLPKYQLALFLNRLFSCDGSIYKHKTTHGSVWEISYSSSSERLIRQVQHLILRFGILSRLRKKKIKYRGQYFDTFELVISTDNVPRFIEEIGFFGAKQKLQKPALEALAKISRNPNVDTIPKDIWSFYRPNNWAEIGRAMGYAHPKAMRERIRYSPSRETLMQISLADQNPQMYLLATSDIFWDEIVKIESMQGDFDVYDIEVPEAHNFIANDIIVHNSYTLGVIAEGMVGLPQDVASNLSCLIFDTMGIYWTMRYPNYRDDKLLKEWGLKPSKLEPVVFVPKGLTKEYEEKGIKFEESFAIRPISVGPENWSKIFEINLNSEEGLLLERVLGSFKEDFSIEDIIERIKLDNKSSDKAKQILTNHFTTAQSWGIFDKEGTELSKLLKGGQTSVLDLSAYSQMERGGEIKLLVIGLLCDKVLKTRLLARKEEEAKMIEEGAHISEKEVFAGEKSPMIWLILDEAHEAIPNNKETLASAPLIQILREGRQPGISLILATQQPGSIAVDALTQADIVLSHRLTAKIDIDALGEVMQTYLPKDLKNYIKGLPSLKGSAVVLDDKLERIYPLQVRPRTSWHGGSEPTALTKEAIKEEESKKEIDELLGK